MEYFYVTSNNVDFLLNGNYNIMQSFINPSETEDVIRRKETSNSKSKIFIDSGAFSLMRTNRTVDYERYINFINSTDTPFVFAPLDTIPYKTTDFEGCAEKTYKNFCEMIEAVNKPEKLVYVYHQSEPLSWLKKAIETKVGGKYLSYICLSNRIDVNWATSFDFFDKCLSVIYESKNPNIRTHAMGIGSPKLLEAFPFYSADSSSHFKHAAYGRLWVKDAYGVLTVAHGTERTKYKNSHIQKQHKDLYERFEEAAKEFGSTADEIFTSDVKRMEYNTWYFEHHFIKELKPVIKKKKLLF